MDHKFTKEYYENTAEYSINFSVNYLINGMNNLRAIYTFQRIFLVNSVIIEFWNGFELY
jgi:deoxyadenosine/deoxycytidine kinase